MRICSVENCGQPFYAKGFCERHWKHWRKHGDPLAGRFEDLEKRGSCSAPGCGKPVRALGLCVQHYTRMHKTGSLDIDRAAPGEALEYIENVAVPYLGDDCLI